MGVDPTADIGWGGPGRRTIRYWDWDPHCLGVEYDVARLLVPWQLAMLPPEHAAHFDGFRVRMSNSGNLADRVNCEGWDLFSSMMRDPWVEMVVPRLTKAKWFRIPTTVPEWIFYSTGDESRCLDTFFAGVVSPVYPLRSIMVRRLEDECANGWLRLQGAFVRSRRFAGRDTIASQDEHHRWYATTLRHTKICCFDGGVFNYPVQKYFEAMACGALVLAPLPRDAEILGFRDGVTMVAVTPENWWDRFCHYIAHDEERRAITANARRLIAEHFTSTAQVGHIVRRLERIVDGDDPDVVDRDYDAELRAWSP